VAVLCDVDDLYAKRAFEKWPQARRYHDFQEMLAAESDRIASRWLPSRHESTYSRSSP
jgi:hypothetical protein